MRHIYSLFIYLAFGGILSAATPKEGASQFGFIENKGQVTDQYGIPNNNVLYLYNGSGLRVQLRKDGFSYEVVRLQTLPFIPADDPENREAGTEFHVHRVDFSFMNANKNVSVTASLPASDYINYYTAGTPANGVTSVQHFGKVIYHNIYPNIDAEFILNERKQNGNFKYNLVVRPGGNLNDIQLNLAGATVTSLTADGTILIETSNGTIEETLPLSYELINQTKHEVMAGFVKLGNNTYGITASDFNRLNTLVIDPSPWATYYGGTASDLGLGVSVDPFGNVIINGHAVSTTNIATAGAYQTVYGGGSNDLFVARFNSMGVRQWATYMGGTAFEYGYGVVTDMAGSVYAAGYTNSTTGVASVGAHQTVIGGGYDGYLAKFDSSGFRRWSTYYGGTAYDNCLAIGIDPFANVFITGYAGSSSGLTTPGAYKTVVGGTYDIHITKFDSSGARRWGTLYGGTADEQGRAITGDLWGNVIGGGTTASPNGIATLGANQGTIGGGSDGFFVKLDSAGAVLWGTYCGGTGAEEGRWLATDVVGNVLFTGNTASATNIASAGSAFQPAIGGSTDAFLFKFDAAGVRQWSTYYGGTGADIGYGVGSDPDGNVLLTGYGASTAGIASPGAQQTVHGGGTNDAFIVKFDSLGGRTWATYLGGTGSDFGSSITSDAAGNVYFAGYGPSATGIILNPALAHQPVLGGSNDAYLAVYSPSGFLPVKLVSFDAVNKQNKVYCSWTTASELNNDYFEVQRSFLRDEKWETIAKVAGQGTTITNTSYTATDDLAGIALLPRTLYYRLKQTDFDGNVSYSITKKVTLAKNQEEVHVYPNPSKGIFTLSNPATSALLIQLIDVSGLVVSENTVQPNSLTEYDYTGLATGVYFIKISCDETVSYSKMVISE